MVSGAVLARAWHQRNLLAALNEWVEPLIPGKTRLSMERAEASVRGTVKNIEVKRWGGEQAHRRVGSLKSHQDLNKVSRPASAPAF